MAHREVTIVRGPISAGYLKEQDLKAIRAIYESLAQLVSLHADKDQVIAAVRVAENAAIRAVEAGSAAAEQAEEATAAIEEASNVLKGQVAQALEEAAATRDQVSTVAAEAKKNSQEATAAADAASLDRVSVSEMKASIETTAQEVSSDSLSASQSAAEAGQSAVAAANTLAEVQAVAEAVAQDSESALSAASLVSADRQAVSEIKASVETTSEQVATNALNASQSATEASQSAAAAQSSLVEVNSIKDAVNAAAEVVANDREESAQSAASANQFATVAQDAARSAGYSFRYCGTAKAEAMLSVSSLVPPASAKVGDHVVNARGDVFEIITISEDSFTVGSVVTSIKGDTGSAGSVAWEDITDKPETFQAEDHSHAIVDVTGLQSALDGKQAKGNYVETVNGKTPVDGNVEVPVPEVDTSALVVKDGNRGQLAGYETPSVTASAVTINADSNDTTQVTGAVAVTVATGAEGTSWTKTVSLVNASATVTLGDSWVWSGGEAPTISENGILVLHWCNDVGVANLVEGSHLVRTFTGVLEYTETELEEGAPAGDFYPIYVYRDGTVIYEIGVGETKECELAVGDGLSSNMTGITFPALSGITFDSSAVVTSVQDGFSAKIYSYM